jgi:hypothetical protein
MKGDKKNKEKEIRGKVNEEDKNMRKKRLEIRTGEEEQRGDRKGKRMKKGK